MASLVEWDKYRAINTTDTSTNIFYVILFSSGAYTLQENTTILRKIINSGELVVKAQKYFLYKVATNWYWNQQPKHNVITVPTCTILHTQIEVNAVTYFNAILKRICTSTHAKKSISRQPVFLTDSEYDYILEEIGRQEKFQFERYVEVYSDNEKYCYEHFKWILYVFIIYICINHHQLSFLFFVQNQLVSFEYEYACKSIY